MKAYKIEVLVIDNEEMGIDQIRYAIECVRRVYPIVKAVAEADIGEWSDEHPLNKRDTHDDEYKRLFGEKP